MGLIWPVQLRHQDLRLRPLARADRQAWFQLRSRNVEWLREWDATLPRPDADVPRSYPAMVRYLRREGRSGRALSFVIEYRGELVGQVTLGGITLGSLRGAHIGYWIDHRSAGLGLVPTAVAMVCDYAFDELHLHRIEINIRGENAASLRVVEKLGFRYEGIRREYLHINGKWRDHRCFVLLEDDLPAGVLTHRLAARDADN